MRIMVDEGRRRFLSVLYFIAVPVGRVSAIGLLSQGKLGVLDQAEADMLFLDEVRYRLFRDGLEQATRSRRSNCGSVWTKKGISRIVFCHYRNGMPSLEGQ
jgi:hypothetical protein